MIRDLLVRKREKMLRENQILKDELYTEQFSRMCTLVERLCEVDEEKGFLVLTVPEAPERTLTSLPYRPGIYIPSECALEVGKRFAEVEGMIAAVMDTCILVCWDEKKFDPTVMPKNAYIIYPKASPSPEEARAQSEQAQKAEAENMRQTQNPEKVAEIPAKAKEEVFVEIDGSDLKSRAALAEFLIRNGLTGNTSPEL